ncbi:SusD/RagB family nutrient-binding outer membrane lipoprotein [Elizabethkingia anophelis]|uniref:SusD/RagB family nutrient-binding outer membrane lipoprotein n=1 Tax=Elizabethkingia anophelis TaxID=1117645 RepID=UPI00099A1275|nr:SusD/RagB family nutrient-binding outer membrane lipoprotein [Elizabethkingia anophelis]MCT3650066.1 SusD/RagB family nutrient-binding outer membrane lipoprotein [Elizabethkingia anophelis]MCT3697219.1 SusD/RagB family nutrient-binding outer membrane lipoprotein [Elizabethkingia anophelis]MCT3861171.1 SusD/RagB family nutrient-binding outer membrane lipoprotein [Elizabethkingia anophelis]MCT3914418.1 SusD/RagB family nutrient-binding outer membrane lipoprotein [Elizabethkingia anophelis]MCT
MKKYILPSIFTSALFLTNCSDFDKINVDPYAASADQVQPEYFLNNAILGAQQDPNIAERAFVLMWKTAARQHFANGIAGGTDNDGWSSEYWKYVSEWLNNANTAIQIGNEKATNGSASTYNNNLIQVARIWRAYLMSEMSDIYGAVPIEAFQGKNPEFNSQKEAYYFMLAELKDAVTKIDVNKPKPDPKFDLAYGYDWNKWIRYANSMRMRLAMRMSEVDPAKAKSEFEAAVATNMYINSSDQNFKVAEKPGWDALTGVMSREWNSQLLSATLNNLYVGLGGVKSADQLGADKQTAIKDEDYIGVKYDEQFSSKTNDPSAGYWFDGLPNKIDPRAYKTFFIPGDFNNPIYSLYPTYTNDAKTNSGELTFANGTKKTISTVNTWNALALGDWGAKGQKNGLRGLVGRLPGLGQQYRGSSNSRIFFASWESYFLIAEAALKGWATPMSDEAAYNKGIQDSFTYNNVSGFYGQYIASTDYNRDGTSVSYNHTTEPEATHVMKYLDPNTNTLVSVNVHYPVNTIYKNGAFKNDKLTKIITQKYLANMPWLPLESWNDHRRLGLPFFENPAIENPLPNLPALNSGNYMINQVSFFPQRLRYPSAFRNTDPKGYAKATTLLGGPDNVFTPMWWAKKQ